MPFELQRAPAIDARRRRGLAVSAALHGLLLVLLLLNPDFFATSPRRVVRIEGQDYDTDRFDIVDLYLPPELVAPPPEPEVVPLPAPEVGASPPPPPEEPAPEPTPPPELPPPRVIAPDDVIAEGARPAAPPAPSEDDHVSVEPPRAVSDPGDAGDAGDEGDGTRDGDEAPPAPKESTPEPPAQVAENTNPNAIVLPNIRRQAESLIDERIARSPLSEGDAGRGNGDRRPNLTTDQPEILSDTRGYDFGPYMNQVINRVRTNWYALIPEAARIGTLKGRVVIVFTITAPGRVENLRAVAPSGATPLDRAAVAAIQASSPFPDLPADFSGSALVLQFTFLYNMEPD